MIAERDGSSAPANGSTLPVSELELWLLLEAVHRVSGYDFRAYAPATLKRRVGERMRAEGAATITGLTDRLLHDPAAMLRFVDTLTYNPNSPFRDPVFFRTFRERVLPRLRTFPVIRIWVTGCAGGEDAYALAMLLGEAGLSNRTRIYATDASDTIVERARLGAIDGHDLEELELRYADGGGQRRLRDYVVPVPGGYAFDPQLRERIVFAQHNLATDGSFNEFHFVVARNVLAHFSRTLAYRAHQIIYESLVRLGFVGFSADESLRYSPHRGAYEPLAGADGIYRRLR